MTIDIIKELRENTGLPFGDIKRALDEARGDKHQALELLKSRGAVVAEKKSARATGEGVVESYIHGTKKVGVLVEIFCETDFVARNPVFAELSHDIAMHIAAMDPENKETLLGQPFIKDQDLTIKDLISRTIAKLGENIKLGRFVRFSL